MCLHAGYNPVGDDAVFGLGQGAPRGVPLHRTAPYQVRPMRDFALLPPAIAIRNLRYRFPLRSGRADARCALMRGRFSR